jgi:acetyltransferase-like isoleucine patch superfamily enzyme
MFAKDVILRSSDEHPVFDIETGAGINFSQDIVINNYVWIAKHVSILKGVTIGIGSIVGSGSIVTKNVPEFTAVAGSPAKQIKNNVTWARSIQVKHLSLDKRAFAYANKKMK